MCLGHTHALTGAAAFLAASPVLGLSPVEVAAGTIVCAGAAMLPDLDHPQATISRTFGAPTQWLARGVAWAFGGHRRGTHSLIFAVAAGMLGQAAMLDTFLRFLLLTLFTGLAFRSLGLGIPRVFGFANLAASACFTLALLHSGAGVGWFGLAVTLGCLAHLAGDCCTPGGCPLAWPFSRRCYSLGLWDTGHAVERFAVAPALSVAVVALAWRMVA